MNINRTLSVTVTAKEVVAALAAVNPGSLHLQAMQVGAVVTMEVGSLGKSLTLRHTTGVTDATEVFKIGMDPGPPFTDRIA
jgi:hypothetical protein